MWAHAGPSKEDSEAPSECIWPFDSGGGEGEGGGEGVSSLLKNVFGLLMAAGGRPASKD